MNDRIRSSRETWQYPRFGPIAVFYETGIAHTLGRGIVVITQDGADVPFDLRHLRYVKYENTVKGRKQLADKVARRIKNILGSD